MIVPGADGPSAACWLTSSGTGAQTRRDDTGLLLTLIIRRMCLIKRF